MKRFASTLWFLCLVGACSVLAGCPARPSPAGDQTSVSSAPRTSKGAEPTDKPNQDGARPPALPSAAAESARSDATGVLNEYKKRLHEAGDKSDCEPEVARVRAAMAADKRLSKQDIQAEIDHFEKVKGPMPYPSPGTACSLFGFQKAARGALADRASAQ